MITVRDAVKVLSTAKLVSLGYNDSSIHINKGDEFMMQAFGDYAVESISYIEDGIYEIVIAMRPIKAGEAAR